MNKPSHQTVSVPLYQDRDFIYRLFLSFFAISLILLFPSFAFAGDPLTLSLCTVVNWFTSGLGRGIATLGIMVIGIGALMGKVSWQLGLTVAVGIAIMFSGAQVVDLLVGAVGTSAEGLCAESYSISAGKIEEVLCNLAAWANSATGQAIATFGIMMVGITALMGKMSAGMGIVTVTGVAALFGADDIGEMLATAAGGSWSGCSPMQSVPFTIGSGG